MDDVGGHPTAQRAASPGVFRREDIRNSVVLQNRRVSVVSRNEWISVMRRIPLRSPRLLGSGESGKSETEQKEGPTYAQCFFPGRCFASVFVFAGASFI